MSTPPDRFMTLGAPFRFEPEKIKGSRFIACVGPAPDEDAARDFLERVRGDFDDARHVCWAYRIGASGEITRRSDDGEPSGSAGAPILAQIEGHELTYTVAAVVRYFGGVKLGVGGLVRAYGGAAGQAMDRAEAVIVERRIEVRVEHAYSDSSSIQGILARFEVAPTEAEYGDTVRFTAAVRAADYEGFKTSLRDGTSGRAEVR